MELLDHCGIDRNSPDRLEALRSIPIEKIVELAQTKGFAKFIQDGNLWPVTPNALNYGDIIGKCTWVDEVVIGESYLEVCNSLPDTSRCD